MPKKSTYFEFEVSLEDVEPRIWRRFLLRTDATLHDLHDTIQKACGWLDYHLYLFRLEHERRPCAIAPEDDQCDLDDPAPSGIEVMLQDVFAAPGDVCIYMYDFGDSWEHRVEVTGIETRPGTKRRILLAGARAFPPEDCGGLPGYEKCLRAFRATDLGIEETDGYDREELLSRMQWLGDWDPEHFDLAATGRLMSRPVREPEDPLPPPIPTSHPPQHPPTNGKPPSNGKPGGRVVPIGAGHRARAQSGSTIDKALEAFLLSIYDDLPSTHVDMRAHFAHQLCEFLNAMGRAEGSDHPMPVPGGHPDERHDGAPTYCQTAEPAAIAKHLRRFLSSLALRKMSATIQFDRAARTLTPELLCWLSDEGYLDGAATEAEVAAINRFADELVLAEDAAMALATCVDGIDFDVVMDSGAKYREPSRLEINRIEPGRLWLSDPDAKKTRFGPIEVPPDATALLDPEWSVVCALAFHRGRWYIAEVMGVLPW